MTFGMVTSRYWAAIAMLIALFLLPSFGVRSLKAASDPQGIAKALPCGALGEVEDVSPGTDLFRIDMDLSKFPNAVCNDGTPATMFVRRYATKADKNKWVVFLLGGGNCRNGQECAQRWCSFDTNYGANKMSTAFLKQRGVKKSIDGNGIFSRDASVNKFAGWNQVFVFYCSSDDWQGSASNVHLSAIDPNGNQIDYLINFRGADIVEAVIATLQREPRGDAVEYRDSTTGENMALPDINKAELVMFTGSSAGGNGVKENVDRVGDLLRKTNKQCKGSDNCPLVYLGVIDANYPPSFQSLDLTQATFCTGAPFVCAYDALYANRWNAVNVATWGARGDESCVKWHQQHQPGTEWMCADDQHVVHNHLTTPLFIRFDQQDNNIGGTYVEENLTTATQFGQLTHDQLLANVDLDKFAEEGSVRSGGPRLRTPGVFGPQCTDHYGLSISKVFFGPKISDSGKSYTFHDVLWNWVQGAQPQRLVRAFAGPGPAPDCP
jgi:hypothetical protein